MSQYDPALARIARVTWDCAHCGNERTEMIYVNSYVDDVSKKMGTHYIPEDDVGFSFWPCIMTRCYGEGASRLIYFVREVPFLKMDKRRCIYCPIAVECFSTVPEVIWEFCAPGS